MWTLGRIKSGLLAMGARRGDRVGVLGHNTPEVMQSWLKLVDQLP